MEDSLDKFGHRWKVLLDVLISSHNPSYLILNFIFDSYFNVDDNISQEPDSQPNWNKGQQSFIFILMWSLSLEPLGSFTRSLLSYLLKLMGLQ